MVKAICKLLNITPSTYHLWNRKDENLITKVITEHPRYMLIQFIKSIFINPDEIYRYIKYEFLPKTNYIEYGGASVDIESNEYLQYKISLAKLLGIGKEDDYKISLLNKKEIKNLDKRLDLFLTKREKLNKIFHIIFNNSFRAITDYYRNRWSKRDLKVYKYYKLLFSLQKIQIKALSNAIKNCVHFHHIHDDLKLFFIKNLLTHNDDLIDRRSLVNLINYIDSSKVTNDDLKYLIIQYEENEWKEIFSDLLCSNNQDYLNLFYLYFPNFKNLNIA